MANKIQKLVPTKQQPLKMAEAQSMMGRLESRWRQSLSNMCRVDGFFDEEAVWSPAAIACFAMIEQLGLFFACQQRGICRCYFNGSPLHNEPVTVAHGDFLVIFKSVKVRFWRCRSPL